MRAQDWIALYAAIVATAGLIWQASTQLYERKPKLRVELGLLIFIAAEEDLHTATQLFIDGSRPMGRLQWRADISVTNLGRRAVHVHDLTLVQRPVDGRLRSWRAVARWGLPWKIEPGEERKAILTDDDAPELDLTLPAYAVAYLATGRHFESEPTRKARGEAKGSLVAVALEPRLLEQVAGSDWTKKVFLYEMYDAEDESDED